MSFAIVTGTTTPTQAQLDQLLAAAAEGSGRQEDRYSLPRLLFYCLQQRPQLTNTIDGFTGDESRNVDILDQSIKTARAMRDKGVAKGDKVIICGTNHLLLDCPYYASLFLGAVPLHLDFNTTSSELRYFILLTEPKFIFADANKIATVEKALVATGLAPQLVSFGQEAIAGQRNLNQFISGFSGEVDTFRVQDVDRYDPVNLCCTSGSTGKPKLAVITNYGVIAGLPYLYENMLGAGTFLMLSSSQWVSYLFFTHICTVFGCTKLQTQQPSTPDVAIGLLRKYRPESSVFGPAFAASLLRHPDFHAGDLSCMRSLLCGGAYVSPELQVQLKEAIGNARRGRVIVICGCTEVCGMYTIQSPDCPLSSIGKEVNNFHLKIVDEDGNELPVGATGELWVRSNGPLCLGYLKDEPATKDSFTTDGWTKTGDLVYKDENGVYFYVDRKKLVITSGIYHIFPAEVEGVIASVEGVAEVGVCWSEPGLAALVVRQPGSTVTAQEIHSVVNANLSSYKRLMGGVHFVPALPHTVTGKLCRAKFGSVVTDLQRHSSQLRDVVAPTSTLHRPVSSS